MDIITILRIVLGIIAVVTTLLIVKDCIGHREEFEGTMGQYIILAIIGFLTNFFDTWGIGSFAPTQAAFKFTKTSSDETVPGTLNVGDTLPVSVEALLFLGFVDIDPLTLVLMLVAAAAGAFVGASIVSKWNIKTVRIVMACVLVACSIVTVMKTMGVGPFGVAGEALGLSGAKLIIGVVCNFFFGALMMVGFGLYAPCTALVAMLGMNIGTAFPIMMGSCALLMNVSVFKFVQEGKYDRRATLMLMFPGALGAFAAYKIACWFSLTTLTYIVCVVMLITAAMYMKDAKKDEKKA